MSEHEGDCWILAEACVLLSVIVNVKRTACCVWTNEIDVPHVPVETEPEITLHAVKTKTMSWKMLKC